MIKVIFLSLIIFLFPLTALSAEVLQINSSNKLLIGDNNRTYKVQLACIEIDPMQEDLAVDWLKSTLPRKTRVNIKPKDYDQGLLVARLIDIKSNKDIGESMESMGFGKNQCTY